MGNYGDAPEVVVPQPGQILQPEIHQQEQIYCQQPVHITSVEPAQTTNTSRKLFPRHAVWILSGALLLVSVAVVALGAALGRTLSTCNGQNYNESDSSSGCSTPLPR